MYFVITLPNNIISLKRTFTKLEQAQAYAKRVHGVIRKGGVEGQTINDYRR